MITAMAAESMPTTRPAARRPDRSYVYAPPRPSHAQRKAALYWLRWDIAYAARAKRDDACSEFEYCRLEMSHFHATLNQAHGAVSLAKLTGLITEAQAQRFEQRLDRINGASVCHPQRKEAQL